MEGNQELSMVKVMLRSVLTSAKEGVPAHVLQRDYRDATFESLPYQKFGFRNLDEFIDSMPDVVRIEHTPTGEIYHAVADEKTAHISKMVSKQKTTKKRKSLKPARRRPAPRSAPFHSPWTAPQRIYLQPLKPWPGKKPPRAQKTRPPPQNRHHLMIHSEAGGQRRVNFETPSRALTKALDDANVQRQGSSSLSRYEVPPRFQRRHQQSSQSLNQPVNKVSPPRTSAPSAMSRSSQKKTSPKTKVQPVNLDKLKNGKKYYDTLIEYCKKNHISDLKFETIPSRLGQVYCYASSTTINNRVYGSGDLFGSSVEAEFAACRTACVELGLLSDSPVATNSSKLEHHSEDDQIVRSRVKEILESKPNGLWNSRLPFEYKERYKDDPPGNLLDLVKLWKDIAVVEYVEVTKKEVFYPVKESLKPPVQAIPPPVNLSQIPLPEQDSCERKDYKIPQGKPLALGENAVVYITFIHSVSCFCVQLEDSPVDDIMEELTSLVKEPCPKESDLSKGRFVAAMYSSDESWYRAEILSESPSNSMVDVLYIDYGNGDKCQIKNTRWLSEKLASYPVQVIYCSLYGIQPLKNEEDFSEEVATKFADLVKNEALVAITQSYTDDGICEVDLFIKDKMDMSINQQLIDLGLVRSMEEIVIEDSISEADIDPEPLKLPEDNEWDIYISFINQSSNSVVVRLVGENYSEKLDEYDVKLEDAYRNCTEEFSVEEDGMYIALVDELYHRVRVLSISGQMVECYFVDHGDTDKVNRDQLRSLDPVVNKLLPYQAVEVSLYGLEEISTNPTTLEKLLDLALGKTCVAEIISRDEGLSVILYDTGNDEDVNINEVIATAVMEETEARMMAQGEFQPASVSPVKNVSSKSSDLEKDFNSLKISQEQSEMAEEIEEENDDSEGSWETEEEEEVIAVKNVKKRKDKNSNSIKISEKKKSTSEKLTQVTKSVSDESSNKTKLTSEESTTAETKSKSSSPETDLKKLYTWGKSSQPQEVEDYMDDENALWDPVLYGKRPLPPTTKIPERGEYMDCHVSSVFDPTNFVCIPYATMTDFDQLLRDCIEYFNVKCEDRVLKSDEIKIGHLYAGHQGGAWYRVLVNKKVGPGLVSVYIVDFGEYNAMAVEEIKPLPWKFWKLPFQAFKCKLHGIKPVKGMQVWSEGAKLKMNQLTFDKDLVGLVCGKDESGIISLRLVDTSTDSDVCIDEILIDLGLAEIIPPSS